MGRYSAVLRRHGKQGFGIPEKAPDVGSFPLYPVKRARFALTIISSGGWDAKKKLRAQISKRAVAAHPSLRSYWNQLRRETIEPRMDGSTSTRSKAAANPRRNTMARRRRNAGNYLENPLGMPLSGNIQAVIVDEHYRRRRGSKEKTPKRVHIKKGKYALCGAGKGRVVAGPDKGMIKGVKPSDSKTITCYRCLKLNNINKGDDVERMIRAPGRRETHMMVPGGREGLYISRKQLEHDDYPSRGAQVAGIEYFLGGTDEHPTQTRLLTARQKRAREDDLRKRRSRRGAARKPVVAMRGRKISNPRSYGQGYERGSQDYHKPTPIAASQLTQRTISYQEGYLEGYADQSSSKPRRKNTKRRSNTRRRSNRGGDTKKGRMSNGRMWYMVDGKFATKAQYDRG